VSNTLDAVYDLRNAPSTFDFGTFLVVCSQMAQMHGRDSINVTIRAGMYRSKTDRDKLVSEPEKEWRILSILLQLCSLVPMVKTYTVDYLPPLDFQETEPLPVPYQASWVSAAWFQRDVSPQVMKAPTYAKTLVPDKCDVTLTLRQSKTFKDRNPASLDDWHRVYLELKRRGLVVRVVPDVEDILHDQKYAEHDWMPDVFTPAAWDMRIRLALYENTSLNIGSANGPVAIMAYTKDCKYLMFDNLRGGWTPEKWAEMHGTKPGGQLPWCGLDQRVTHLDSTYENMIAEFDKSFHHPVGHSR
jgi:hypothetical protein